MAFSATSTRLSNLSLLEKIHQKSTLKVSLNVIKYMFFDLFFLLYYKLNSLNKRYTLRRHSAAPGFRFARSVAPFGRSFPRKPSPTFGRARLARPNVVYLERYAPVALKYFNYTY
jgi:hypothetical protein